MSQQVYLHKQCRACKGTLEEFLNLGDLRLNAFPQHAHEIGTIPKVPLVLTLCPRCGLVQLDRTVPADWMYRTYWYRSGVNETMVSELRQIVEEAVSIRPVGGGDCVLDIGANDGTLLSQYKEIGRTPFKVAVEPAYNLHDRLTVHADAAYDSYFPTMRLAGSKFSIITAIAMCYDLEEPVNFFQAIHDYLEEGGVAIVQFQDFEQQIQSAAFDNICHEHLEYYTLWSLMHIVSCAGLMIQRVKLTPINGGSLRVFLRRVEDGIQAEESVAAQLVHEARQALDTPTIRSGARSAFHTFTGRVKQAQVQIASVLETAREQGCVVDVYGASTKGNILLQVLGIGPSQVRQAIDRSPEKVGYHTITGIPIVSEETARVEPADMWLVPIWQFKASALRREAWYLDQGGTMVFPLPCTEVVRRDWKVRE